MTSLLKGRKTQTKKQPVSVDTLTVYFIEVINPAQLNAKYIPWIHTLNFIITFKNIINTDYKFIETFLNLNCIVFHIFYKTKHYMYIHNYIKLQ